MFIVFTIDAHSDIDTSSELGYDSDQASLPNYERDEDNLNEGFEPEFSKSCFPLLIFFARVCHGEEQSESKYPYIL